MGGFHLIAGYPNKEIRQFVKVNVHNRRWFLEYLCQTCSHPTRRHLRFEKLNVQWGLELIYDWCTDLHVPVRRWSSLDSVQQVVYKGEIDQEGAMLGRAADHKVVCSGRHNTLCSYSSIGNSSSDGPLIHQWMCNPSKICSCGKRLGRRHSF